MNIKMLRKQIAKGEWEYVEIDIDDAAAVEALKLHNKEVNHKIYEEKKLMSKFSVEQIEAQIGHEFEDEGLDPLQKLIEEEEGNFYTQKEDAFEKGLALLGQAMSTLTENQKDIFEKVIKKGMSFRKIAEEKKMHFTTVEEIYNAALKKLRKFFLRLMQLRMFLTRRMKSAQTLL